MGKLFRRYWIPACLSEELPEPDGAPKRVRLLGEDLVAFRDSSGAVGLVSAFCPHRRAPMFFGRNENCGLRCVYHGWKFDRDGNCVDMPSEPADSLFKSNVTIDAYPTWEGGGMVWAYLGPAELRRNRRRTNSCGRRPNSTSSRSRSKNVTSCRRSRVGSIRRTRRSCTCKRSAIARSSTITTSSLRTSASNAPRTDSPTPAFARAPTIRGCGAITGSCRRIICARPSREASPAQRGAHDRRPYLGADRR